MSPRLVLLPLLLACGGPSDEGEKPPADSADTAAPDTDTDTDTVVHCGDLGDPAADCDDNNADVGPECPELCNGIDDNCNGAIDEGVTTTFFEDRDGDGAGDPLRPTDSCDTPSGYVANSTDCDDTDPATHPGADEHCGGADEDCDGTVDEDDAVDALPWYADTDADGYGDAAVSTRACTAPTGTVADATDCVDTDPATHPGADEHCGGADEDCDGTVDEPDAVDAPTWYADTDADGYGDAAVSTRACVTPTGFLADTTDCDDTDPATHPGADEYCGGADEDCDGTVDEDDAVDVPTWYADTDADGYGDAAVSTLACAAPAGTLADATDCDDTDPAFHPGAADGYCDGGDYDCDGAGLEGGSFTDTAGAVTDLSALLQAATYAAPAAYSATADGELEICAGTWYLLVSVDTPTLTIAGAGSGDTILSAAGNASVVEVVSSSTLTVEDLALTGATTSALYAPDTPDLVLASLDIFDNTGSTGAGVYHTNGALQMDDSWVQGNIAQYGAGLYLEEVIATVADSTFDDNYAYYFGFSDAAGGGIYTAAGGGVLTVTASTFTNNWSYGYYGGAGPAIAAHSELVMEDSEVSDNLSRDSWQYGHDQGALGLYADATITDSYIINNSTTTFGSSGGLYIAASVVIDCSGGGGVYGNTGNDYGGVGGARLAGDASLQSIDCDWGSGATDNTAFDISAGSTMASAYNYGSNASFTCTRDSGTCY
ncbi:MAG: putative metal-binding motif-containing protein [Pseudomonadota bacterium]|nr:putative metal-binding motif-containing protein [Pseudomonadota bacterium]